MKHLVIDTETGGLDPKRNALLSIGAVLYDENETVLHKFDELIAFDPASGKILEMRALAINKMTPSMGVSQKEGTELFLKFLQKIAKYNDVILIGHNLQFDTDFIENFLNQFGIYDWMGFTNIRHNRIDTAQVAGFLKQCGILDSAQRVSLEALHEALIENPIARHHSAMGDCEATWEVFKEMRRRTREKIPWSK